jgi:LysM repeat protein
MTTLGRVVVTVAVAAVLITLTAVAAHYLSKETPDAAEALAPPSAPPPAVVETPTRAPASPAAASSPPAAALPATGPGTGPSGLRTPIRAAAPDASAPAAPAMPGSPAAPAASESAAPPVAASTGAGGAAADAGLAMAGDRPLEAQKRLSEALRAGIDGPKGQAAREALNSLAGRLQLSAQVLPGDQYSKSYTVASGDALVRIGRKFLIPHELVMRINGMNSTAINAGQRLKVVQGPVHLEIFKGRRELQAWLGDVCLRVYAVGVGTNDRTPTGTFTVKNKMVSPPYQPQHKPKSEFRDGGAPDNPLGTRWIDIGNSYGVHGTIDPSSIGKAVSEGCVRMHNKEVEELYDLVVVGATKVTIHP